MFEKQHFQKNKCGNPLDLIAKPRYNVIAEECNNGKNQYYCRNNKIVIFNRYDMNDTSTPKQDEIKGYVHIWTQFPQLHVDKRPG